jgi:hypothetical protein
LVCLTQAKETGMSGCNPTFGDEVMDWVDNEVNTHSYQLASADYHARTLNYFIVGLDDLHQRMAALQTALDLIAERIHTFENRAYSPGDDVGPMTR